MKNTSLTILCSALLMTGAAALATNATESGAPAPEASTAEAVLPFRDIPVLETAFIDTSPAQRDDGILVGALNLAPRHEAKLTKLATEIGEGKYGRYDSMLIMQRDQLVFESYFMRGRINLAHGQASATKGYTSLILGRAIELGYLTLADLDKPIIDFLQDIDRSKLVAGAEQITLHKALTMHGGLNVPDERWQELEKDPVPLQGQGLVQTLFENSDPITDETQVYRYGNFNPMLVMTVIDAVVPGSAQDFIKTELLDKLGITNFSWGDHISGLPQAGWMVSMASRDMLKWGSVAVNEGRLNGEQLISSEYLAKATSPIVNPTEDWIPDSYRYGYFWYHTPINVGDKTYDVRFAWGGGGQRVIVVEALELVIVITGHDRDDGIMTQVSEVVIPAFAE